MFLVVTTKFLYPAGLYTVPVISLVSTDVAWLRIANFYKVSAMHSMTGSCHWICIGQGTWAVWYMM